MVAVAILVPHDADVVTVIEHIVETEIIPLALWQQRINLDSIVRTRTESADACDNHVAEGRVVVITTTLLVALEPIASYLIEVFANVWTLEDGEDRRQGMARSGSH